MNTSTPRRRQVVAAALTCLIASSPALASQKEDLLEIRNTILNLVDALVEQGVLTADKAAALKREAAEKAKEQAREAALAEAPVEEPPEAEAARGVIRVPYVPEFVKEEIRADVRSKLRADVVEDVMRQAKNERWGMPQALPDWTRRFSFDGDIRLRGQADSFSDDNLRAFLDFQEINDAGGLTPEALRNVSQERRRARLRLRLGVEAKILNDLTANVRLATGTLGSPVSTNQTLGNDFGSYNLVLDRAFLKRTERDADNYPWLTLWGGRLPNPFLSTDLLWDSDLNFDGGAATFRYNLAGGEDLFALVQRDRTLFATVGAFALDEIELEDEDKWLWGAQVGTEMVFPDQSELRLGLAYYDYRNISGRISQFGEPNFSAPGFLQKGNSLFDISSDQFGAPANELFGLASDYDLVNLTAQYRITKYAPVNIVLTGDYVRNVGYDASEIRNRLEGRTLFVNSSFVLDNDDDPIGTGDLGDEQVEGYHAKVAIGWPEVSQRRSWQVSLGYKYLERDAVLDAFTDSDFHLGGTNAKGWILGAKYGLLENTYVSARYLSADEIDGPPLGIDVLQLDLISEF